MNNNRFFFPILLLVLLVVQQYTQPSAQVPVGGQTVKQNKKQASRNGKRKQLPAQSSDSSNSNKQTNSPLSGDINKLTGQAQFTVDLGPYAKLQYKGSVAGDVIRPNE